MSDEWDALEEKAKKPSRAHVYLSQWMRDDIQCLIRIARATKPLVEATLMARGWFEGNPEGALEEIETRARAVLAEEQVSEGAS